MIYLDNAATSFKKPQAVYKAMYRAMTEFGANAGRGGHKLSIRAAEEIFKTRKALCDFFHLENAERIAFFPNATYALNAAISGVMRNGGHIILSQAEHNSVMRPVSELAKRENVTFSVVKGDEKGKISVEELSRHFKSNTRMVVMTGASNVCGNIYDTKKAASISRSRGAFFLLDAAQTAGVLDIDAKDYDMVAFAGHKGLMGPQGTGGLYVSEKISLLPFASGGTGSGSERIYQPAEMPDIFESGTQNMPAIAGLGKGIEFINKEGINALLMHERELLELAMEYAYNMKNVVCYGEDNSKNRVGVLSFNIKNIDSVSVANELSEKYNIATRGGLHCAPLAHKMLKTQNGTVRMSFGYFNTKPEVKKAMEAIYKMQKEIL